MALVLTCPNHKEWRREVFLKMSRKGLVSQEKVIRYRRWQDRQAHLLGRLLLEEGLRQLKRPTLLSFHYDAFGKPYLENGPFFNISHTDGWVVCALSEQGEIGVDVERKKPVDPKEFSFVFTAKERIRMQRIEQALQPELFFSFWTRKEALIKADGRAMQLPLHLIDVQKEKVAFEGKLFYLEELKLNQEVALAVATCQPESIDLRNVTPDFLQGCGLREEGLGYEV